MYALVELYRDQLLLFEGRGSLDAEAVATVNDRLQTNLAFVVPDHVRDEFASWERLRSRSDLHLVSPPLRHFIEVVPAQMRSGQHWYRGTADSVLQNMNLMLGLEESMGLDLVALQP